MKWTYKIIVAVAAIAVVAMVACTSYEDPDIAFKGKIDKNFLSSVSRGETSVTYTKKDSRDYFKDIAAANNSDEKWREDREEVDGWSSPLPMILTITDGRAWSPIDLNDPITLCPSLVSSPWIIFCKETGYDKEVYIACDVEYNEDDNVLKIGNIDLSVEKASDNQLTASYIYTISKVDNDVLVPWRLEKTVVFYERSMLAELDKDKIIFFETEKEAKIAMVQMLREYFGDEINLNHYGNMYTYPIINLALLEDDLRNDRDEDYSWRIYSEPVDFFND